VRCIPRSSGFLRLSSCDSFDIRVAIQAEVVLLDDVLSALDVHTSRWIVDQCLVGDLLRSRTVILVTHNVAMTGPFAQFVVSIGSNGRIASQGTIGDALSKNKGLLAKVATENEAIEGLVDGPGEPKKEGEKGGGKLMTDEEIALGHVSLESREFGIGFRAHYYCTH
jgi:ABC-type multidrug transport system ATPase subunit